MNESVDRPVSSRSVTHRVARRRRLVADESPSPVDSGAEPAATAADASGSTDRAAPDTDPAEPVAAEEDGAEEDGAEDDGAEDGAEDDGSAEDEAARPASKEQRRFRLPFRSRSARRRPTAAQRERRWRVTSAVLASLLVAVTVAGTIVGLRWNDSRETADGLRDALAAGRQSAVNFMSLSVATVDRDMQRIIDGATGDFKQEYERNKATFRNQIVENKAESTCTVLRSAILSGDSDSAVVLIAMDATVRNVSTPEGRLAHYRLQLDVVKDRDSGRWLVSRLQFVG